jgi:hypothetical protein
MEDDIPFGIILFHAAMEYSEACAFCSDLDLDVLEYVMYSYQCLLFFSQEQFILCCAFCVTSGFHFQKYVLD